MERPMPLLTISSQATIAKCAALELDKTDIFICSYPKSGTTWLQHIVISLIRSHLETTCPYEHVSDYAPFFEIDPHWDGRHLTHRIRESHSRLGRRVFNTHLRFDMLPATNGQGKFIYITRSPLDTCVSFFHHLSHQVEGGFEGNFDSFFHGWLDGSMPYGTWHDHVASYAMGVSNATEKDGVIRLDDNRQFLFLLYEDLVEDLPKAVALLVEFLDLGVSPQRQRDLLPTFRFDSMKANIEQFQPKSVQWRNQFSFLRQGQCGDARHYLSEQQRIEFCQSMEKRKVQQTLARSQSSILRKLSKLITGGTGNSS